jgi:hypothetical protein
MKMPRSLLERIIKEELAAHLGSLLHEKQGTHPEVEDAEGTGDETKTKAAGSGQPDNLAGKPSGKKDKGPKDAGEVPGDEEEKPADEDPADTDLEKQATGEESADEEDDEAGPADTDKVSDQLVGKTIQSVTANPKSKLMPGAMEIVIQFDQTPDPLKILVTKSGTVKYFYRGLHNEI